MQCIGVHCQYGFYGFCCTLMPPSCLNCLDTNQWLHVSTSFFIGDNSHALAPRHDMKILLIVIYVIITTINFFIIYAEMVINYYENTNF